MTFSARRIVTWGALTLLVLGLLTYGAFEARKFLQGPFVIIEVPQEGARVAGPSVEVSGVALNISFITLNGRQIYVDEEGRFKETLIAPAGYTVLTVDVKDRFDRVKRATRTLVVE